MANLVGLHALEVLALEENVSGGQRKVLIDQVEDGGFARAIGADEGKDLAPLYLEAHAVDCHEPAKILTYPINFEEAHCPYHKL
jgi:hypothetical protein